MDNVHEQTLNSVNMESTDIDIGSKYIYKLNSGYCVRIENPGIKLCKNFKTLEEATIYRDDILSDDLKTSVDGVYRHGRMSWIAKHNGVILGYYTTPRDALAVFSEQLDIEEERLKLPEPKASDCSYNGVRLKNKRWNVNIGIKSKTFDFGSYTDPDEAGIAFNTAALEIFGPEYPRLNTSLLGQTIDFPDKIKKRIEEAKLFRAKI